MVQSRLRALGTATSLGGASLLDALCGLLVALSPPASSGSAAAADAVASRQHSSATVAVTPQEQSDAALAASALTATEVLLRADAGAATAALASCGPECPATGSSVARDVVSRGGGGNGSGGNLLGPAAAADGARLSPNISMAGPHGMTVLLSAPPWAFGSARCAALPDLPSLRYAFPFIRQDVCLVHCDCVHHPGILTSFKCPG